VVNLLQLNAGYQFIVIVNSLPILLEPEKNILSDFYLLKIKKEQKR